MDEVNSMTEEFLKHIENKIKNHVFELRKNLDKDWYNGIEDMYQEFTNSEISNYTIQYGKGITLNHKNSSCPTNRQHILGFELPENEKILFLKQMTEQRGNDMIYYVMCITNYGRFLESEKIRYINSYIGWDYWMIEGDRVRSMGGAYKDIISLKPILCKLPTWFIKTIIYYENKDENNLHEISKDFFNFAGKFQDFISKNGKVKYEDLLFKYYSLIDDKDNLINKVKDLNNMTEKLENTEEKLKNIEKKLKSTEKKLESTEKKLESTEKKLETKEKDIEMYKKFYDTTCKLFEKNNLKLTNFNDNLKLLENVIETQSLIPLNILEEINEYKTYLELKNKFK